MPEATKERLTLAVSMGSRRNEPLRMEPVRKDAGFVGHVKVVDESADLFFFVVRWSRTKREGTID